MGLFVWNRLPISVVAILGSVAMAMFIPEMDLSAVYSGFSATGWPLSLIHIFVTIQPYCITECFKMQQINAAYVSK